jgi:hypothetical protein
MVLRLVLVSIVAGLGVTPPTESEVAGWSRTVQTWLDAQIAEWKVTPLDDGQSGSYSLFTEDLEAAALEREFMELFNAQPGSEQAVPASVAVDQGEAREFEAIVDELVAEFSQDGTEAGQSEVRLPVTDAVGMTTDAEPADLEAEIVEAELDSGAASPNVPAPAMATLTAGEDALFEVVDEFEPRSDLDLARQAPPQAVPAPGDEESPAIGAAATNPLRDAVRLTRDAVYAWINLLQSPALVTVPE